MIDIIEAFHYITLDKSGLGQAISGKIPYLRLSKPSERIEELALIKMEAFTIKGIWVGNNTRGEEKKWIQTAIVFFAFPSFLCLEALSLGLRWRSSCRADHR